MPKAGILHYHYYELVVIAIRPKVGSSNQTLSQKGGYKF